MKLDALIEFFQPQQVCCVNCGGKFFDHLDGGLCKFCLLKVHELAPGDIVAALEFGRDALDYAASATHYGEAVRAQVFALKYGGARRLGLELGRKLLPCAQALPCAPDALIPVPLHFTRRLARGYNQSEALAEGLGELTGWKIDTRLLVRRRRTRKNALLDHAQRMLNVENAFALNGDARGKRLLLIDDVLTTGSTVAQCARTLKAGGASWVGAITYARAGSVKADAGGANFLDYPV